MMKGAKMATTPQTPSTSPMTRAQDWIIFGFIEREARHMEHNDRVTAGKTETFTPGSKRGLFRVSRSRAACCRSASTRANRAGAFFFPDRCRKRAPVRTVAFYPPATGIIGAQRLAIGAGASARKPESGSDPAPERPGNAVMLGD